MIGSTVDIAHSFGSTAARTSSIGREPFSAASIWAWMPRSQTPVRLDGSTDQRGRVGAGPGRLGGSDPVASSPVASDGGGESGPTVASEADSGVVGEEGGLENRSS